MVRDDLFVEADIPLQVEDLGLPPLVVVEEVSVDDDVVDEALIGNVGVGAVPFGQKLEGETRLRRQADLDCIGFPHAHWLENSHGVCQETILKLKPLPA